MSAEWLSYANLSDHYERKARFVPGVLAILPLLIVSAAYGGRFDDWVKPVLSGVGLGAILAVAISHLASAFGNRFQAKIWPEWPHDAPTNRWLHPQCCDVSTQQKKLWYSAINALTGLDIESAVEREDPHEIRSVINDAVSALRPRLWRVPEGRRLYLHNVDYGFARNLTGLRAVWLPLAILAALACWTGYIWHDCELLWCIVSTLVAAAAIPLGYCLLPAYVRRKAHYYAESFFDAVTALGRTTCAC